jgi:selenocysteine lyase/cysteine desulfurase
MMGAAMARIGDRSLFPRLEPRAYLNHAAISPPSEAVVAVVDAVVSDYASLGVGAHLRWHEQRQRLRQKLAALIGASAESIGFAANTTRGVTDVALCFPWERGDRLLLVEGEFPANVTPWQRAAELFGLEVGWLPPLTDRSEGWLARLDRELEVPRSRLVAVSAVEFQTGMTMPLAEIGARCASHGAELFVDAIQACGVVPIDVGAARIDYLSCGSHKWLMGTEGAAFVYIAPSRVAAMRPHVAGWLSHDQALSFLFEGPGHLRYDRPIRQRADFIEGGMANTIGLAALEASLDLLLDLGIETIADHVQRYHDALEPLLAALGLTSLRSREPGRRSGILSFDPPPSVDVVALHHAIDPKRVSCATPDGKLRFSPHWPNALDEVPLVATEVAAALKRVAGDRA